MKLIKKHEWPSKTTLNLVINEKPANYYRNIVILAAAVLVVVCLFGKFAVADRLSSVNDEWDTANAIFSQYEALLEHNRDYAEVRAEFDMYFANNTARGATANSAQVLQIIDERLLPFAKVKSVSFLHNTLSVVLQGIDLEQATRILSALYEYEELVESVELYTASQSEKSGALITMTIVLSPEGGDA